MRKRLLASLLVLCLTLALLPATAAAVVASGYCGRESLQALEWVLDDTGTLTISGTGDMENYSEDGSNSNLSPWYNYKNIVSAYKIKAIVIGNGVTSIGSYAFHSCGVLTSITLPASVTSIGEYAFQGCNSLTSITLPDAVTSIGACAFKYCWSLTSVTIPNGVTSIEESAFSGCSSLTSITLPASVTSIGDYAFEGCSSLTSVTIPDSVTSIGECAFSACSSLTSVTIPDRVTSIEASTFYGCSNLTSVTIPDGVTSLKDYTFCFCEGLTEISIPSSVARIGCGAFAACSKLKDINYGGNKSDWSDLEATNIDYSNGESGNNNSLRYATVHCTDGDIAPRLGVSSGGSGGGGSAFGKIKLDEGVKYVPYSCRVENKDYALAQDTSLQDRLRYELKGTLPSGLDLDSKTSLISGVPTADGTWNFYVKRILSDAGETDSVAELPCSLTILSNTDAAVQNYPNDYEIIQPVGTPDSDDPNHFYKDAYTEETLKIDGPFVEFYRLLIDGRQLNPSADYTAEEGSTVITIHTQTFQRFGEGTHTIAAEFRSSDNPNTIKRVAQNYTLNLSKPSSGGSSGGGSQSKPSINTSAQKPQTPPQPQEQQTAIPFTDVSPADWYYDDVVWACQEGVMQGVDGSRFDPEGKVSQAVIVTVLARLAKVDLTRFDGETEPGFPDGQYFTTAAIWAKRAGLLPEEGAFTGSEATTRNQMAVMLAKYLTSMGKDTTPPTQPVTFDDASEMSQEGNAAFQVLYQYEIFRGTGGLKMEPAGSTTRAQFAALMHRIYDTAVG